MTCKLSLTRFLVGPCVTILTLLSAAAILAQPTEGGQLSRRPAATVSGRLGLGKGSSGGPTSNDNLPWFVPPVAYGTGIVERSVAVADVNGDGKPDLLVATIPSVAVLLGNGDGTFQPAQNYTSADASDATGVAVGDLNGDGKLDLVVSYKQSQGHSSEGCVGVLLGNGDGTFQDIRTYDSAGIEAMGVAMSDLNGDGKLDVVVINFCRINNNCGDGSLSVLLGAGNGAFQDAQTYDAGGLDSVSIAVSDVNGDGKPDLVVGSLAEVSGSQGVVTVFLGNGDGTFQGARLYESAGQGPYIEPAAIAVGDVNGDGRPDIVVSSQCLGDDCDLGAVGVLLGNGDGSFRTVQTYWSGGYRANGAAVGDVNGDGKVDLLVANACTSVSNCRLGLGSTGDGSIGVLLGNGDGSFQAAQTFDSGGWDANSVAVGNLNGDGKLDLLATNACGITCLTEAAVVGVLLSNDGRPTTTTTLGSSANPLILNQTVTYTATVQSPSGEPITGTVAFEDSWKPVATVSVVASQATYSTSYADGGQHPITVVYSGDAHNAVSTSEVLVESITGPTRTTTMVTTSGSPSHAGQPVTFTATVMGNNGPVPNGEQVRFYAGTHAIGTGTTASGIATFVTSSLKAGAYTIKAFYDGDGTFMASWGKVKQVVVQYSTATALSSSLNPSGHGQAVTFTATVTSTGPLPPTGKVTFKDGTTGIGTATLSGGVATLTRSNLAVGTHPITAHYGGDIANSKSASAVLNQVVQ
jgi:hypothetical protein